MITGGHIAVSYLLSESTKLFGVTLTNKEVIGVIIAGNIVDIDFITGLISGKTGELHHQNVTHTPIGTILICVGINFIFNPGIILSILLLIVMLMHLILDDIGYWMRCLGLYMPTVHSQINWLYPLTQFREGKLVKDNTIVLKNYLLKAWPVALIEIFLIAIAIIVFIV